MDTSALVTVSLLGAACVAALVALRALGRRGATVGGMRVVGRLPLEPRRSLVLVEAGGRCFLLGVGDGPIAMLAELDRAELAATEPIAHAIAVEPLMLRAWRRVVGGRA